MGRFLAWYTSCFCGFRRDIGIFYHMAFSDDADLCSDGSGAGVFHAECPGQDPYRFGCLDRFFCILNPWDGVGRWVAVYSGGDPDDE